MQILIVRHGKTAGNLRHRYVGRTDERLCEQGIVQLREQFSQYSWNEWNGKIPFITSPMQRCIQTAEILALQMGIQHPHLRSVSDLREMDFGEFEYKSYEELNGNPDYQLYIDTNGAIGFPGAEPLKTFKERCIRAFALQLRQLDEQQAQKAVFVVHGGTIMAVMEHFVRPYQSYFNWQTKNGCGYFAETCYDKNTDKADMILTVTKNL